MKLYRCYDNRLRPTERSPALYGVPLEPTEGRKETSNGRCDTVLDIADDKFRPSNEIPVPIHPFGQLPPCKITMNWLWDFCGRVKVICTEFHEGVHYAKRPEHFIPIINHLEQLHKNGYVHGDIRAYNMVLKYPDSNHVFRFGLLKGNINAYNMILDYADFQKNEGWLIDFDYGGKIIRDTGNALANTSGSGEKINPNYPKGYAYQLADGLRNGIEGRPITFDDDWYALGKIIFDFHTLLHSNASKASWTEEFYKIQYMLNYGFKMDFFQHDGNYQTLDGGPAKFLRDYLQLATDNKCYFKPEDGFKRSLKECHLIATVERKVSKGATGSPPMKDVNAQYR